MKTPKSETSTEIPDEHLPLVVVGYMLIFMIGLGIGIVIGISAHQGDWPQNSFHCAQWIDGNPALCIQSVDGGFVGHVCDPEHVKVDYQCSP